MSRRGRPRHPDLLTPREQQVLALLREGLTNPQIAERLGISLDGAKYHVAEIMGKLGVESREEAAAWSGERRSWWALAATPWRRLANAFPAWLAVGILSGIVLAVLGGAALLVVLLVRQGGGGSVPIDEPGAGGFRAFAAKLQAALDAHDITFLDDRIKLTTGTCTTADIGGGIGAAPCSTPGAPWAGFLTGFWHSEGGYVPSFGTQAFLQDLYDKELANASDAFGDGAPRVYALNIGDDSWATIITELQDRPPDFAGSGPPRTVKVLSWTHEQNPWKATRLLNAAVLAQEFLLPCQDAIDYLHGTWEHFPNPNEKRGPGPEQCSSSGLGTPVS